MTASGRRVGEVRSEHDEAPEFTEQPQALNGASHLINDVFGAKGRHSRMIYTDPGMSLDCTTLVVLWASLLPIGRQVASHRSATTIRRVAAGRFPRTISSFSTMSDNCSVDSRIAIDALAG